MSVPNCVSSSMFTATNRIASLRPMSASIPAFVPCPAALLAGLSSEQKSDMMAIYARAFEQAQCKARPMVRAPRFDFRWN